MITCLFQIQKLHFQLEYQGKSYKYEIMDYEEVLDSIHYYDKRFFHLMLSLTIFH